MHHDSNGPLLRNRLIRAVYYLSALQINLFTTLHLLIFCFVHSLDQFTLVYTEKASSQRHSIVSDTVKVSDRCCISMKNTGVYF